MAINIPSQPSFTCNAIDKAKKELSELCNLVADSTNEQIIDDIVQIRDVTLENLRDQNVELREWGESLGRIIEDCQKELDEKSRKIDELESTLKRNDRSVVYR